LENNKQWFGERKKLREKAKSCYFAIGLLRKQIFLFLWKRKKINKVST
jgi:hypothetical protein